MIERNIVYYGDRRLLQRNGAITRPLVVVFLTSIRDVGIEDRNGTKVETGNGKADMEGVIERTVREMYPWWRGSSGLVYAGILADVICVGGVITDDISRDLRDSSYSTLPERGRDWIFDWNLRTPDGRLVRDMTYNIPSTFRRLPREAKAKRRQLKYEFEYQVLEKFRELRGDILVSDHYMARLDHLWREPSLFGRLLNIHPAVTVEGHPYCNRGPTPTANSIARARREGFARTGATLHFIGPKIDEGPPIAYVDHTPVFPSDEPQWLRYRNYLGAKLPLFVRGLAYYAHSIYPYLDELDEDDLIRLQPLAAQDLMTSDERTHRYENILFT